MEWLYLACIVLSGLALVAITLIIPSGVFMRYVLQPARSWPEPAAVIMMVMFSFLGGAATYRANVHIAVEALLNSVGPKTKRMMLQAVDGCMAAIGAVHAGLWASSCASPRASPPSPSSRPYPSAAVYAPIPLAGLLTLLFIIEKVWVGAAAEDFDHVPRPGRGPGIAADGRPRPARLLHVAVRARRAGRLRARPAARSSRRSASTSRWKR